MKLSADQREAIAGAIWDYRFAHGMVVNRQKPKPIDYALADVIAPLAERWLGEAHAGHAPDESPGDVIAAYPDGTIILDDGITTWNPRRATEFLLGEARRDEQERLLANVQRRVDHAQNALDQFPESVWWCSRRDALAQLRNDLRYSALGVIEGSEATP